MKDLKDIIAKASENDTPDVKRFLFGSIELTNLKCTDSEQSIMSFVDRVNKWDDERPYLPHPATICVYPCYAEVVKEYLQVEGIGIACVSGSFPSSQTFLEVKTIETALAIKDGATEIDMVMPVGKFLSGDEQGVSDEITEMKAVCGPDIPLKVILETGCLKTEENITTASYVIQSEDHYVRTEINVNGLQHFYLNPVTRHATPEPVDQRLDVVNKAQTYLYWFVYIVAFAALAWYLFKMAKAKKEESK